MLNKIKYLGQNEYFYFKNMWVKFIGQGIYRMKTSFSVSENIEFNILSSKWDGLCFYSIVLIFTKTKPFLLGGDSSRN